MAGTHYAAAGPPVPHHPALSHCIPAAAIPGRRRGPLCQSKTTVQPAPASLLSRSSPAHPAASSRRSSSCSAPGRRWGCARTHDVIARAPRPPRTHRAHTHARSLHVLCSVGWPSSCRLVESRRKHHWRARRLAWATDARAPTPANQGPESTGIPCCVWGGAPGAGAAAAGYDLYGALSAAAACCCARGACLLLPSLAPNKLMAPPACGTLRRQGGAQRAACAPVCPPLVCPLCCTVIIPSCVSLVSIVLCEHADGLLACKEDTSHWCVCLCAPSVPPLPSGAVCPPSLLRV